MKKVAVLLLAAGLVFGAAHKGAQAADIKVSGEWDFNTDMEQYRLRQGKG